MKVDGGGGGTDTKKLHSVDGGEDRQLGSSDKQWLRGVGGGGHSGSDSKRQSTAPA